EGVGYLFQVEARALVLHPDQHLVAGNEIANTNGLVAIAAVAMPKGVSCRLLNGQDDGKNILPGIIVRPHLRRDPFQDFFHFHWLVKLVKLNTSRDIKVKYGASSRALLVVAVHIASLIMTEGLRRLLVGFVGLALGYFQADNSVQELPRFFEIFWRCP